METHACKPENYRGIAINSSIGKLFNSILNNRFDKFLSENNVIKSCQIGFSKKSWTSDHVFVLKTLKDKHINKKVDRLFACFIDTVKHAGIKYKLLKQNMGGNFYSIIKDMYIKNKLCVKIEHKMTSLFKSDIGVRQGGV